MTNLWNVLLDSFRMLFDRPQLFVPRLFSALVSSLLIIGLLTGKISQIHFLAFFPFIAVLGAFTPVMVSSMVKNTGEKSILKTGFEEALKLWKPVLGLVLFTVIVGFANSLPLSLGLLASSITGNNLYFVLGGLISVLMLLAIGFILYFVPVSIIENKSFLGSLKDGFSASNRNRLEVMSLTVFSLTILGLSSVITGYLRDIGLTVFFIGRMVSSIVGTYFLVVSPKYYIEEKSK